MRRSRACFASASPRLLAELEDAALAAARALPHPLAAGPLAASLGALGLVPGASSSVSDSAAVVTVDVAAPFPASPRCALLLAAVQNAAQAAVAGVAPAARPVVVKARLVPALHCAPANAAIARAGPGLAALGSVVAVSSCKGGVGKSTVAVNLAFALRALGGRVALLDSDIHGPSLPTMVSPASLAVTQIEAPQHGAGPGAGTAAPGMINALDYEGVALMSYGWVARRDKHGERGGAAMRGPMVSQVVGQLLRLTQWGERDHLVLDLPPGTGDVQITLGQAVPITGAVIVTTPQRLAVVDVIKGMSLFETLKVPMLAVVLNMAHFDAPDTGRRYFPFGEGGVARVHAAMDRFGVPRERLFTLPIDEALSAAGDSGVPEVVANPGSASSAVYASLARCVAAGVEERIFAATHGEAAGEARRSLRFDSARGRLVLRVADAAGARESALRPAAVRRACRCAACVDEITGRRRLDPASVADAVVPTRITEQGHYGVGVAWSDGHDTGIFSFEQLQVLAASEAEPV